MDTIIKKAEKMRCYQDVDTLAKGVKCKKTIEALQDISRRLYLKEERFAQCE